MQHPLKKASGRRVGAMRLLLGMGLFVALAAGFALLAIRQPIPLPVTVMNTPVPQAVSQRPSVDMASITVQPPLGESYQLLLMDGSLQLRQNGALLPIKEPYNSRILQACTHMMVVATVAEDTTGLSLRDMGLAPPRCSVVIHYRDGSDATLLFGTSVPHGTDVYAAWSEAEGAFLSDAGMAEVFTLSSGELLPVPALDVFAPLVTEVRVQNAKGSFGFALQDGARAYAVSPYRYPLDAEGRSALLSVLASFRLGTPTSMEGGFDNPLCRVEIVQKAGMVNTTDENGALVTVKRDAQTICFTIGQAEGAYFYTCQFEGQVYLVSRFLADALVNLDAGDCVTRTPAALGEETLKALRLQTPQDEVEVEVIRHQRVLPNNELATDESGTPLWDTIVIVNGQKTTQDRLDMIIDCLQSLTVAGDVPTGYCPEGKPRWTLWLQTETGAERLIAAYRMDAFADALCVDGVCLHYVHADALDALTAGWL